MFFAYDKKKSINVNFPFKRIMTPYMMPDTASCPIDFSTHMTEWEPGGQVDEHFHANGMEVMYCLSGCGTASVNDNVFNLTENTMIAAAPGEKHCIKNTGSTTLRVLCIFSPPVTADELRKRAESAINKYQKNSSQ